MSNNRARREPNLRRFPRLPRMISFRRFSGMPIRRAASIWLRPLGRREHGIRRIYTRDTDFHRFPFLEPIDPLA
jgi:hypothetical protein